MFLMAISTAIPWFALVVVAFLGLQLLQKRNRKLPPGPPGWPLVGNLSQFPLSFQWLRFTELAHEYGDLVSFHGLGNTLLVLNSMKSINDLLDERGSNYSHRPISTMANDLLEIGEIPILSPYGPLWKFHRKLAHHSLGPKAILKYIPLQQDCAAMLVKELVDNQGEIKDCTRLAATRVVTAIAYAIKVNGLDDEYVAHTEETARRLSIAFTPGKYLVEFVPLMKYLPSFFAFQREAKRLKEMAHHQFNYPFNLVKQEIEAGTAKPSMTCDLLSSYEYDKSKMSRAQFEEIAMWATSALYIAGVETTDTILLIFILCMVRNPVAQRKAQEELDRVVGPGRLPSVEDRHSLPYTMAVIKETMRWSPPVPLSISRRTENDDVYEGYFIPAGTLVLPNIWNLSRQDENGYAAEDFIPERFLEKNPPVDPRSYIFGFGRRICPGQHLAENSLFLMISYLLATCTISPALDANGNEIPLNPKFLSGVVSYPESYKCSIKARSSSALAHVEERVNRAKDASLP